MTRMMLVVVLCAVGCVDSETKPRECGPMPEAPDWEYTIVGGGPPQAQMDSDVWFAQLDWRAAVIAWGQCVTGNQM